MSQKSTNKIKTDHEGSFLVTNPFAGINTDRLPKGSISKANTATDERAENQQRGRVEVTREKSGRAGKTVTILRAFPESVPTLELDAMAFKLRKQCACGGSLKDRTIELQGDVCQQALAELEKEGFSPIRCGY